VGRDLPGLKNRHVYDARVGERTFGLVWDRTNERLITTDNVAYLHRLVGKDMKEWIARQGHLGLTNPAGYGQPRQRPLMEVEVSVGNVQSCPPNYTPHIPLLTQPLTFMSLVPAAEAMKAVEAIRAKYTVELGKVRNRLPMYLGLVVFPRRTPIYAVMDGGRRMLRMMTAEQKNWQVYEVSDLLAEERKNLWRQSQGNVEEDPPGVLARVKQLILKHEPGHALPVPVPAALGNGDEDGYYPMWRVTQEAQRQQPLQERAIRLHDPVSGQDRPTNWAQVHQLVAGSNEEQKDRVAYHPSLFDFEFLDTTTRRFEVGYDENGRRRGRPTRPYYLEELDALNRLWDLLAGKGRLTATQIKNLEGLLCSYLERWRERPGEEVGQKPEFARFVDETLANTGHDRQWWRSLDDNDRELLKRAAQNGMLLDVLELRMFILKQKPAADQEKAATIE
jgi:hypothetical protein